jgi:hypothetical protein
MRFFEKQSNMKMELMKIINPKLARGHKQLAGTLLGSSLGTVAGAGAGLGIGARAAEKSPYGVVALKKWMKEDPKNIIPGFIGALPAALNDVYLIGTRTASGTGIGAIAGGVTGNRIGKHLANKAEQAYKMKRLIAGAGLATAGAGAGALALSKKK